MRRFVIEQGAKLRPIDDGLEAQLNSAYTSTIRLDLQDADYVVALALDLGKSRDLDWVGKTLDLSKAYKQLPITPDHRDLAVVFFTFPMPSCSVPLLQFMLSTGSVDRCGS